MTDAEEAAYISGERAAAAAVVAHALGRLGYEDTEASRARWVIEREATIAALRSICARHGDNDWDESLHLADVIDKHLGRHLDSEGGDSP